MIVAITGTHKGIGRKLAEHYLAGGNYVAGCSRHDSTIDHENYRHYIADVRSEEQTAEFAAKVRKEFKHVDALINNTGIAHINHFMMTPIETAKNVMDVNYFGSLMCTRAFINLLKRSDHPRIVNFSSVAVPFHLEGELAHSSSKAAIENMTKVLAREVSDFKITVNAIGPSPVNTDLIRGIPEEKIKALLDRQVIHRLGTFNDIINVIDFYLRPESDFITGQVIYLGGGLLMKIDYIMKNLTSKKDLPAAADGEHVYTFGDIHAEYIEACKVLDDSGITSGSVVTVIGDFSPKSIAFILALIERDAIIVPVSLSVKDVDGHIRISQSGKVIDLRNGVEVRNTGQVPTNPLLLELISRKHPGLIAFSSGTTGDPKALLHDMSFLMRKFEKPGKSLRTVTFLLFDHLGGFNTLMYSLANAGFIVTLRERTPDEVCRLIEKYRVELLPVSPTFINLLLLSRVYEKYDMSSLKMLTYGTEPMPETTLKAVHRVMPNVTLKQTYGLSEVGVLPTKSKDSESLYLKLGGGGGVETKIVDDILYIRAESAMMGYLNAPSPFDAEGWLNTQDKVEVDGDYIKILGRTTDLINVGGEKVYPNEVESVLLMAEGVRDVRVYGEDNPLTGKSVCAEILVSPENNNREFVKSLRRFSRDNLEPFKRPASYKLTEQPFYSSRFKKQR